MPDGSLTVGQRPLLLSDAPRAITIAHVSEDRPARTRPSAADRVASILVAAETTADEVRQEAEIRVRARIAEGERAGQNRVDAAEAEATELIAGARSEAQRLAREARERDEAARTTATREALAIIARAQESADETLATAAEAATRSRSEAERSSREMLTDAHTTADAVRSEGMELVGNLRAMGDSLRANAERLLRDVQSLHSQMISRIEVVEATRHAAIDGRSRAGRPGPEAGGDDVDVPEFIPRR